MTLEEKALLQQMQHETALRYKSVHGSRMDDVAITQAYANCSIALQLDRIATALESDSDLIAALVRIANGVEILEPEDGQ